MDKRLRGLKREYIASRSLDAADKYIAALERTLSPVEKPTSVDDILEIMSRQDPGKTQLKQRAEKITTLLWRACKPSTHSPKTYISEAWVEIHSWFRDSPDYHHYPLEFLLLSDEEILARKDEFKLVGY